MFFEAGESVHTKWRLELEKAKAEMGLIRPAAGKAASFRLPAHDNDNNGGDGFAIARREIAS